jgi:hypothetical protein
MSITPSIGDISVLGTQWIRSASLVVAKKGVDVFQTSGPGLDLSDLHFRFTVRGADVETPNTMVVRVYNLADSTRQTIIDEFDQVSLQAGYKNSSVGIIFTGGIKQFKKGRESNVDSFLEITAADNDLGYNFGFVNTTLAAGATHADIVNRCAAAMGVKVDPAALALAATGGVLPRGRVLFGLARVMMREVAETLGARWSVQNGTLVLISQTSFLPSQAVLLNSQSGLIGTPEATEDGVEIRCLLNPLLQVGCPIQIANDLVNQRSINRNFNTRILATTQVANVTNDGLYRVLSLDHSGDTRGQDYYSDIVALAINPSSPPATSVQAFP